MFGQSLLSAFGSAACTTDTDQLFATDVQTTSTATYQLNNATTSIPNNTYPGTENNITYAAGKFGNAAVFNGNADIDVSSSAINTTSPYTISMWLNIVDVTQYEGIFANVTSSYLTNQIAFVLNNGKISIYSVVSNGNTTLDNITATPQSAIANNTWFNLVIVADRSLANKAKVFFNNVEASYVYQSGGAGTSSYSNIKIGLADGAGRYFNGYMDQIRFFNSSLPQPAITALYNETTTTAQSASVDYQLVNPNSIAYYKMSDAADQLGNYNGTASNVNFNTIGKFGFAGAFNGSSSQIELPSNPIGTNLIGSISLWLQGASFGNSAASTDIAFYNRNPYVLIDTYQNNLRVIIKNSSSSNTTISYALSNFNTSDWYNIAVVLTGVSSTFTLYVNGSSVGTATAPSTTRNVGSTALIGLNSATWDGSIDQIRIYDSALSAANVTKLYKEIECPAVAVTNAFNTVLYTGNSGTQPISTVGFKPDLIWIKERSGTDRHVLTDSVRGTNSQLSSQDTNDETTYSSNLVSFDTNGFTLGSASETNGSNDTYVAWNWKAGGTAVSNTDGTITSQVSANVDAGFSVVKWSMSLPLSGTQTIGHGISTPDMIIYKNLDNASQWQVYTQPTGNGGVMFLNLTNGFSAGANKFPAVGSTTFTIGQDFLQYPAVYGGNNIAYCFTSIPGYSRVGSYVGTGANGNNIVTGFEPRFVMIKRTDSSRSWLIFDSVRGASKELYPDLADAEYGAGGNVINSDGFAPEGGGGQNVLNGNYIFLAIA